MTTIADRKIAKIKLNFKKNTLLFFNKLAILFIINLNFYKYAYKKYPI